LKPILIQGRYSHTCVQPKNLISCRTRRKRSMETASRCHPPQQNSR
jgi:hypothetical protein